MNKDKILDFLDKYRNYLSLGLASLFFVPVSKFADFYVNNSNFIPHDTVYSVFVFKWILTGAWWSLILSYILSIFELMDGYPWFETPSFQLASFFAIPSGVMLFLLFVYG